MKKDLILLLHLAKKSDEFGNYRLSDSYGKLLEKNYRYSQANELTLDNFIDRLFQFVERSKLRDANGNVSFVDAFNKFSYFGARINNVSISQIPVLVNLRNIVGNSPGRVFMPDDIKNMLSGNVSNQNNVNNNQGNNRVNNQGNNVGGNNIFVSNSPMSFAMNLFQFARNNNFSNLTRAFDFYKNNAFYNGMRISNNKPFEDLYLRVRNTNSVITESMLAEELSNILGGNSRPNNNEPQNDEEAAERDPKMRAQKQQAESQYQSSETFKEYIKLIEEEPASGLESLRGDINGNNYLSQEDKNRLIKYLDSYISYRVV